MGGEIISVIWEYKSKSKKLFTRFITGDKVLLGYVSCNSLYDFSNDTETKLELDWNKGKDFKIGIYDLTQLQKMISILDDTELKIEYDGKKVLRINDGNSSVDYICSDLSVINNPPPLQKLPDFQTLIFTLTDSKKKFSSGYKVFEPDTYFYVLENKKSKNKGLDEIIFSIGYNNKIPTNRVDVCFGSPLVGLDDKEHFYNSRVVVKIFEILDMFGVVSTMLISNQGLAHITNDKKHAPTNETKYGIRYDYYFIEVNV